MGAQPDNVCDIHQYYRSLRLMFDIYLASDIGDI